jgi:predicted membrane-bound mannosyltransferase
MAENFPGSKTNDDNPVVSNQDAQAESSMNTSVETIVTDTSVDTIMTDILVERQDTSTTNKTNGIIAYENTNDLQLLVCPWLFLL